MLNYILKRFLWMILTVWIVITLTFVLMHSIPGDPLDIGDVGGSTAAKENLRAYYNLDQPLAVQYVTYIKNIVTLDFGPSMTSRSSTVNDMITSGFPASLTLGISSLIFSVLSGVVLGVVAALRHNKVIDHVTMVIAVLGISIPNFIQSMLFINYIGANFDFFPVARWGTWRHVILPALALSSGPMAIIARLTRSNMLEVLTQDYIRTAKAKGLSAKKIVIKHALRNALLPVVTIMGALTASVLTGSFVIERVFAIPGIGQYFVNSISNRDYPMIMATTVIYSTILVFMMFVVDILYGIIDPRIKLHKKEG